jgi:hypothetical protein
MKTLIRHKKKQNECRCQENKKRSRNQNDQSNLNDKLIESKAIEKKLYRFYNYSGDPGHSRFGFYKVN